MKRDAMRFVQAGIALALLTALGWLGGCSDGPGGLGNVVVPPPEGLIVSDPVPAAGVAALAGMAPARASGAGDSVAYVSLTPGTVPAGRFATIHRVGGTELIVTTIRDGGLDPVPVGARVGDSIEVVVADAHGVTLQLLGVTVRPTRPPVVVNTDPPRKKTDVPVNAALVVVFSEPVAGGTVTPPAIQLLQGTTAVGGTVRFLDATLDASHVSVEFVPDIPLAALTPYQLIVTNQVHDLDGEALAVSDTVTFTTGQASTGPPASIRLSVDSTLNLVTGATYQLTAAVRDAAGNEITDQPVTWASAKESVVTVSPTGRLTALVDGLAPVTASVGRVSKAVYVYVAPNPAASITIAPNPATVAATDTLILAATVRDAAGRVITGGYLSVALEWTSSAPAVATVIPYCVPLYGCVFGYATITGISPGSVTITATSGTARGTATLTVGPARPVASVSLAPDSATLVISGFAKLFATLRDANNQVVSGRKVTWTSGNAAVATVDTSGLVRGVSLGSASVIATAEGFSDTAAITVTTISVASVTAGGFHTCGLTASGAANCWGLNNVGQLGFGTGGGQGPEDCGGYPYPGAAAECSTVPVGVSGGLTFASLSAGGFHTCGLTTSGAAYCWGIGQLDLGQGNSANDSVPGVVSGGLTFSSVSAGGGGRTCGLTTSGAAYCWGYGQPSNGSTYESHVPLAVSGGLTFASLSAGGAHTCGLTTGGAAFCWGFSVPGNESHVPVAVSGGLTFASLSAGGNHTCGLTTSGAAYCWGVNGGALGNGLRTDSSVPVKVTGQP